MRASKETIEVLQQLKDENYEVVNMESEESLGESTPWIINGLVGLAAWLSAILGLFFVFLQRFNFFENKFILTILGFSFIVGAMFVMNSLKKSIFVSQITLAFCILGEIFAMIGIGQISESVSITIGLNVLIQIFIIYNFKSSIHRLLSVPAIIASLLILVGYLEIPFLGNIILLFMVVLLGYLWLNKEMCMSSFLGNFYNPIIHGLTISFIVLLLIAFGTNSSFSSEYFIVWLATLYIVSLMIYYEIRLMKAHHIEILSWVGIFIMILTVLFGVVTLQSPGILAAILIFTLSFNQRNTFIMVVSFIALILYSILYYYNMEVTLLIKSIILMSCGVFFLIAKFTLSRMGGEIN
jgi:hypothetical protein